MQLRTASTSRLLATLLVVGGGLSCGDATGPEAALEFDVSELRLDAAGTGTVVLSNRGALPVGPVELRSDAVLDAGSASVPGARLTAAPTDVPTLAPGQSVTVTVGVDAGTLLQPGEYRAALIARTPDGERRLDVLVTAADPQGFEGATVRFVSGPTDVRQGDVTRFVASATDSAGGALSPASITWSVAPTGAGFVAPDGSLVAYAPGSLTVRAHVGAATAERTVTVRARGLGGQAIQVGEGSVLERHTSDLWVHGEWAYTGTWGQRARNGSIRVGDALHVWSLADPVAPVRVGTVTVDARTVNDVKVRADGRLAVLTHEGSNDGLNGVTVLDLSDPAAPQVLSRYTAGLESGVHNAWIEGDYAYLVVDGVGNGMRVLDLSDPRAPSVVASYWAGSSFLHDIYVRDGLAFLSHWNAGLVVLDVGNGIAGGSPTSPVEVSRLGALNGQTHNAWYWPEAGYVFVGEEDFSSPGYMHVVDVRDLRAPREVATFRVAGTTPHNFWLDEATGILYLAWYENGLRALDVNGELLGDLERQGREIFGLQYDGVGFGCASADGTCTWAPQLHRGLLYLSDMNNGLVVVRPEP